MIALYHFSLHILNSIFERTKFCSNAAGIRDLQRFWEWWSSDAVKSGDKDDVSVIPLCLVDLAQCKGVETVRMKL